jgi:hypothetical protein
MLNATRDVFYFDKMYGFVWFHLGVCFPLVSLCISPTQRPTSSVQLMTFSQQLAKCQSLAFHFYLFSVAVAAASHLSDSEVCNMGLRL